MVRSPAPGLPSRVTRLIEFVKPRTPLVAGPSSKFRERVTQGGRVSLRENPRRGSKSWHSLERAVIHKSVELGPKCPSENRVSDEDAGLDVPLVSGLGEIGRCDEGSVLVDDDALGMEAGPLFSFIAKRSGVVEDLG